MVAPLQGALGINEDVGNVLHVAYFMLTAPYFEQRVVSGRTRVCWIEQQTMRETRAPYRSELPVLALDVVDDGRARPGKEGRHDEPHALPRPRRGKGHDMLWPIVP